METNDALSFASHLQLQPVQARQHSADGDEAERIGVQQTDCECLRRLVISESILQVRDGQVDKSAAAAVSSPQRQRLRVTTQLRSLGVLVKRRESMERALHAREGINRSLPHLAFVLLALASINMCEKKKLLFLLAKRAVASDRFNAPTHARSLLAHSNKRTKPSRSERCNIAPLGFIGAMLRSTVHCLTRVSDCPALVASSSLSDARSHSE